MNNGTKKLYVVRKYIVAKSAAHAIKLDKTRPVDDVWMDEGSKTQLTEAVGFTVNRKNDDD